MVVSRISELVGRRALAVFFAVLQKEALICTLNFIWKQPGVAMQTSPPGVCDLTPSARAIVGNSSIESLTVVCWAPDICDYSKPPVASRVVDVLKCHPDTIWRLELPKSVNVCAQFGLSMGLL